MNDELMLLWQQGARQQPDAAEVARLAGRVTVTRFDRKIAQRNLREYGASVFVIAVAGFLLAFTKQVLQPLLMIAGVSFVVAYIWWNHRRLVPLDPTADARSYQTAMLARIDHQMRLLRSIRYWYLLPLYIPGLGQVISTWPRSPAAAITVLVTVTATFAWVARLNERVGISRLQAYRDHIEALYAED